ncbi:MAG: T9SS type A sorting domain-containing protein [Bacteroidales bacterium]|nr:T9SS type A sorting domain-containing protein [Bacteroidales bacterium]
MSASAEWFFLYPNPSDGRFSVVFNKDIICDETTVTIGLFTLQGARITEHQVTGSERFEFDENLNNGIYVLRITTNSNLSETRQIIIQN